MECFPKSAFIFPSNTMQQHKESCSSPKSLICSVHSIQSQTPSCQGSLQSVCWSNIRKNAPLSQFRSQHHLKTQQSPQSVSFITPILHRDLCHKYCPLCAVIHTARACEIPGLHSVLHCFVCPSAAFPGSRAHQPSHLHRGSGYETKSNTR